MTLGIEFLELIQASTHPLFSTMVRALGPRVRAERSVKETRYGV